MALNAWTTGAASLVAGLIMTAQAADLLTTVDKPPAAAPNTLYPGNRAPLLESPLICLPFGSIAPQGWLRKQLEQQADGFVGHLTEISGFCNTNGNAWLSKDGAGKNGWEEVPYWLRGYCAMAYVLNDPKLVASAQPWLEAAIASQREDGYFGPRSNLHERGDHDLMSNQNMLYALRSYYEFSGDDRVLKLMQRYFDWELAIPDKLFFSSGWQVPRNADDMASAYWLYNRTGNTNLLALTAKLQRCGATWMRIATGGHNVDFSQGFRKPAQFYQQNRDPLFLQTTEQQWESMTGLYGQVPGGAFGGDEFARPGYTDPRQAIETCGAVELTISHEILLRITGDAKWADRCENIAFNTLPATMTADMKALRYLTSPNQVNSDARSKAPELADGGPMQVMNPHDHRCCQHNSGAGWPYFAQNTWMATPGNGLAAVMYAPTRVTAKVGPGTKTVITEETHYPFDGTVTFKIAPATAVAFPLFLRVPAWCNGARLTLNGRPLAVPSRPGTYLQLSRTWQTGDTLVLELPTPLIVTTWKANQNSVSVNRGPLTFSLRIGEDYVPYEPQRFKAPWQAWEIRPTTPWNYALQLDAATPAASLKAVSRPWPADDTPFTQAGAPVEIQATARKLPNWREDHLGLVDKLQPSPVKSSEPVETVTLIPMGAARIRLSAFPQIGSGPDAHEWQLPPEPLVSYSRGNRDDPYDSMFDGRVPTNSANGRLPHFTTYSFGGAEHGKLQWVRRNFDKPTQVAECAVFWYDETARRGDVRLPKSWRVLYLSGKEWKPVENPSGYGVEPDCFNTVTFTPVTTTALRLEVQTQNEKGRYAMGIHEWKIPGIPLLGPEKK